MTLRHMYVSLIPALALLAACTGGEKDSKIVNFGGGGVLGVGGAGPTGGVDNRCGTVVIVLAEDVAASGSDSTASKSVAGAGASTCVETPPAIPAPGG